MSYGIKVITAPTTEPVTLAEAKLHLKIETADTADDALVTNLIKAAREMVEDYTRSRLMTGTYELYLDEFPNSSKIDLDVYPIQTLTSVKYLNSDGVETPLSTDAYSADLVSKPCRIFLKWAQIWPVAQFIPNAVYIRYVAGYTTAANVPAAIKAAMLLIIGHLYEHREDVQKFQYSELPNSSKYLLNPYRYFQY